LFTSGKFMTCSVEFSNYRRNKTLLALAFAPRFGNRAGHMRGQ
jgi:hypothetical protein